MNESKTNILEEAQLLVYGERQKEYGSPASSYARIASMFSTLIGKEISASEAAMFMILVKLDRENHKPKRDNRVDGAGYFGVLDMIRQREEDEARLEALRVDQFKIEPYKIIESPACGNPLVFVPDAIQWPEGHLSAVKRAMGKEHPQRPNIDEPRRHG